jgi:hypothetical protein
VSAQVVDRREAVLPGLSMALWLPMRAPNLNDLIRAHGQHAQVYNRLKKRWADLVVLCIGGRPIRCRFGSDRPAKVHFELVEPDRKRDPDNIAAGAAKLILDGLVKAGVLEGDGWAHIAF